MSDYPRTPASRRAAEERYRAALVAEGLSPEEVERGMQPLLSFHAGIDEEQAAPLHTSEGEVIGVTICVLCRLPLHPERRTAWARREWRASEATNHRCSMCNQTAWGTTW